MQLSEFMPFVGAKQDRVLGVFVSSESIFLVELETLAESGRFRVRQAREEKWRGEHAPWEDAALFSEALLRLSVTYGLSCDNISVCLPRELFFVYEREFPPMEREELVTAARWDIETNVPFDEGAYWPGFGRHEERLELAALPSEYGRKLVDAMTSAGLCTSLKHFPGYGGNSDTHMGMSTDVRDISEFEKKDLLPFYAGIAAGAQSVMVAHNIVTCFDPDYPASLSYKVHEYLRKKIGFDGVIITDSLTMNAIRQFTGGADPCVRALLCGNDMIITSLFEDGYNCILNAVKNGVVPMSRLDEAVRRILQMKRKIGLDIGA